MNTAKNKGFTLVEMAIVLVIIGIILAGVMKGRDIVRGSQVKQFSQQFAQKWATVAQTYYDKTGQLLLDGTDNGAAANTPDGLMNGGLAVQIGLANGVQAKLESVGITPCTLVKSKLTSAVDLTTGGLNAVGTHCTDGTNQVVNIVQTTVEGEYAGTRVVQAELKTLTLTLGGQTLRRNCVILYNVPTDVAQGLDTAIDGKADGASGSCIGLAGEYPVNDPATVYTADDTPAAATATAWGDAADTTNPCQTVGIILDY